jgi:3-isopropylmalate/(R)-2-methylmalate dehydratase large subunit
MTFAEKAISIKSSQSSSRDNTNHNQSSSGLSMAGDIAVVSVDLAMAQDSTGPLAIRSLNEMRIDKLYDPSKVLLVIDHTFPAADEKVANLHALMRKFASKHGCMLVEGSISHQHILENLAYPGMMILGGDSHTCQAGCLGAFATGIGSTEIASIWASGQIWLRVPETVKVVLSGNFNKGVFARDLIIDFIGKLGEDGANYRALEWTFSDDTTRRELTIDSRACISNASMECGAKLSVFPFDNLAERYIADNPRKTKENSTIEIHPGTSANYADEINIECNSIEPMISGPDHPDAVRSASEMAGVAIRRGYVEIYLESGAVFTNATCGACVGTHLGALGDDEICISSSSRNFVGRMGALSSKVYLSSPATAAASAIEGKIASPERYL